MKLNRRQWLGRVAAGGTGVLMPWRRAAADSPAVAPARAAAPAAKASPACPLALQDFQPRSMLHVEEHQVARAAFPVIDVHAHFSWSGGLKGTDTITFLATPQDLLPVMDRKNVQTMCNLTGGTGPALAESIARFDKAGWVRTPAGRPVHIQDRPAVEIRGDIQRDAVGRPRALIIQ